MRALKRHNESPKLFVKSALRDTELRHDASIEASTGNAPAT
jgi:hypothetical protein